LVWIVLVGLAVGDVRSAQRFDWPAHGDRPTVPKIVGGNRILTTARQLKIDQLPGEPWLWAREEASVERGGLGRGPAVAPVGAVADFGDRAGVGDFAEHGEGGVGFGWSAERAPAASVVDDVEPRIRELLAAYPRMPATVIAERIGWS
jgi:hypothetical protein